MGRAVRADIGQDHRYAHSVRVARFAERLAVRHGEDPDRARIAGMLHDLARLYEPARLLAECEARAMPIDAFERRNPIVLHARLGAELARERYGIDDPEILSAIAKHTVAAPAMSRLETILYLADGLEPGRTYAERASLAELAFENLDEAMRAVLRSTLDLSNRRRYEAAPQTYAALASLDRAERSERSA